MADAATLFCLLESAAGYSLFEVVAMDEIAALLEDSAATITDLKRFGRAVKLKSFLGFESAASALENANAVSEHAMTDTLRNFLEANLPASSRKKTKTPPFALGVIDPALATAISSGLGGISCRSDETVREVLRGCRLHLPTLVKGLASGNDKKAQLGLGHSYSRSKVKFNPARSDNMIIQSIALLDQLDKDVNTFAMRVREWYSWHFPELKDIVKDNIMYARTAAFVQDKSSLLSSAEGTSGSSTDKFEGLVNVLGGDDDMARAVVLAAKTSMGMDCSSTDMINIVNFTSRMVRLAEYRKQLGTYLSDKMNVVAPNLSALIGDSVAARLISKAGSLTNLAKSPASTVQILGAEKALFRALKSKGNTPKYGLIYHSTFIGRADAKNKGRISRYLANKCAIATRIDSFGDEPTRVYGEKLREQVEERLRFYETGQAPRKNLDVMHEAALQAASAAGSGKTTDASKERNADDSKDDHGSSGDESSAGVQDSNKKKKKKRKSKEKSKKRGSDDDPMDVEAESSPKKMKRESRGDDDDGVTDKSAKKKKHKKKKSTGED